MLGKRRKADLEYDGWLTVTEAAHRYNIRQGTLYRWVRQQKIQYQRYTEPGRTRSVLLIQKLSLEAHLQEVGTKNLNQGFSIQRY